MNNTRTCSDTFKTLTCVDKFHHNLTKRVLINPQMWTKTTCVRFALHKFGIHSASTSLSRVRIAEKNPKFKKDQ